MRQTTVILPILGVALLSLSVAASQQGAPKEPTQAKDTHKTIVASSPSTPKHAVKGKGKQRAVAKKLTHAVRIKKTAATTAKRATSMKAITKTSSVMTTRSKVTLAGHVKRPGKHHSNTLAQAQMVKQKGSVGKVQHAIHRTKKHSSPNQTTKKL